MKRAMLICLLVLGPGCSREKKADAKVVTEIVPKEPVVQKDSGVVVDSVSQREQDKLITYWYMNQSQSAHVINDLLETKIEGISKVEKRPDAILKDQLKAMEELNGKASPFDDTEASARLKRWHTLQVESANFFCRILKKPDVLPIETNDDIDLLEMQMKDWEEIEKRIKP